MILERMCALLHASGLPKFLWSEAVNHVTWLKNRTVMKALPPGKMPFEMLYKTKPVLLSVRKWGCKLWVHDNSGTKLDGQAKPACWVGYDEESKAHQVYWPEQRAVTAERN